MKYSDVTEKIINAAYKVHNVLGFGFHSVQVKRKVFDKI